MQSWPPLGLLGQTTGNDSATDSYGAHKAVAVYHRVLGVSTKARLSGAEAGLSQEVRTLDAVLARFSSGVG